MKIYKKWFDLPIPVERNIDIASNLGTASPIEWVGNVRELLKPYNATYDTFENILCFEREADYHWFLLRWS